MRLYYLLTMLILIATINVFSEIPDDPSVLLGKNISGIIQDFGPPAKVYALRGPEAWQDDVVFEYADGFSFFLFGDRVWQIRLIAPYGQSCLGVFIGDTVDKICAMLGKPYTNNDTTAEWRLPSNGYPVRMRILIKEDKIFDIYIYRADF